MVSQADKFKIGLFVGTSLLLAMVLIVWLGASRYFEPAQTVVAYFSESVQGLEADSPVKFRGVQVGRVRAIRMAPDGRLIEVIMKLDRNFKITNEVGVKMNLLGLTGLKYLEMDTFKPDQNREPIELDFQPRYPVIATYPSDIREIGNALEKIFQKVNAVDVDRISSSMFRVSMKLEKILADPRLEGIGGDAADTLREIKDTAKKLNEELTRAQPGKAMTKTFDRASEFFQESTQTVRSADRMIRRTDNSLNRLTQKLDRSADNLIDFTRTIKDKPSSIISIWGSGEKAEPKR